jgi:hypothetical protein
VDITRFRTDEESETDGVWVTLDSSSRIKVARQGNPNYRALFQKRLAPYRSAVRQGTLDEETAETLLCEVMAETILLDWEGIEEGGTVVAYSKKEAVRWLSSYKDFKELVTSISEEMEVFRLQEDDDAGKTSETASDGS